MTTPAVLIRFGFAPGYGVWAHARPDPQRWGGAFGYVASRQPDVWTAIVAAFTGLLTTFPFLAK